MDFAFFNVKIIRGFTSTFVAICYATSNPIGFLSGRKRPPIYILKIIVTTMRNKDKKVALIRVDEYGALERSSEFTKICHNTNIIFQTTGGDESSINGKIESPIKILNKTTEALLLN